MKKNEIEKILKSDLLDQKIALLNSKETVSSNKERYLELLEKTFEKYGDLDYCLLSSPGRSEICGNHTDHQNGKVIAASVNMDNICFVAKNENNLVEYQTLGFEIKPVDLNDLSIKEEEKYTTESLIRGIAFYFKELGYEIGGFKGLGHCNVLMGSGISSSASFEILVCQIFNQLYNDGKISDIELAKIAQYAENNYFMKPCGLLDQMAISVGGFVYMDFKDPKKPIVEKIDFDFKKYGYNLILVNTKGDHKNLSQEYSFIPQEIKEVSRLFEKDVVSEIDKNDLMGKISFFRDGVKNDRAFLRSLHVLNENENVLEMKKALKEKDIEKVLKIMYKSGNSSFKFLQNVFVVNNYKNQNLSLALCVSETFLKQGAVRVHGGGFEGTIQAIVADDEMNDYLRLMHNLFGDDSCFIVNVRPYGGCKII